MSPLPRAWQAPAMWCRRSERRAARTARIPARNPSLGARLAAAGRSRSWRKRCVRADRSWSGRREVRHFHQPAGYRRPSRGLPGQQRRCCLRRKQLLGLCRRNPGGQGRPGHTRNGQARTKTGVPFADRPASALWRTGIPGHPERQAKPPRSPRFAHCRTGASRVLAGHPRTGTVAAGAGAGHDPAGQGIAGEARGARRGGYPAARPGAP